MARRPLDYGGQDHASEKQPEAMQLSAEYGHRRRGKAIDHAERRIDQSAVDKTLLLKRRRYRFSDPARKAVNEKQPEYLISRICHCVGSPC